MLAEGEHPRLWRRTVVFQQGVDTRAERGHDGVYGPIPLPVMLAEGEYPQLRRRTVVIQQDVDIRLRRA
jgi:hypothetical protein